MKKAAILLLVMFITAIAMPTVVSIIKKSADISMSAFTEEEQTQKELTEFKAPMTPHFDFVPAPPISQGSIRILYENLSRHDNVAAAIFSPPPEQA